MAQHDNEPDPAAAPQIDEQEPERALSADHEGGDEDADDEDEDDEHDDGTVHDDE
jgi:hypothetical protein